MLRTDLTDKRHFYTFLLFLFPTFFSTCCDRLTQQIYGLELAIFFETLSFSYNNNNNRCQIFLFFQKNVAPYCTENKQFKEYYFSFVLGSPTFLVLISCPAIKNQYFYLYHDVLGKTKERNVTLQKKKTIVVFGQL